jgi:hypothetical protein
MNFFDKEYYKQLLIRNNVLLQLTFVGVIKIEGDRGRDKGPVKVNNIIEDQL